MKEDIALKIHNDVKNTKKSNQTEDYAKHTKKINPMEDLNTSFLSKITWSWVTPFITFVNNSVKKDPKNFLIKENDLFSLMNEDDSTYLTKKLEKAWNNEVNLSGLSNASFNKAIFKAFKKDIIYINLLCLFDTIVKACQALLIGEIVSWISKYQKDQISANYGIMLIIFMTIFSLIIVFAHHLFWFYGYRAGYRIKIAICGLIARKTLKLSQKALNQSSNGQIINLAANDANKIEICTWSSPFLWITPTQTLIMLYFLYDIIGISGIFGFFIIIFMLPLQGILGKKIAKERRESQKYADTRLKTTNELISSMRVFKYYAWEKTC